MRNASCRLMYFKTWSPVGGTAGKGMEHIGDDSSLEEESHCGKL